MPFKKLAGMKNTIYSKLKFIQYNCIEAQRLAIKRQETKLLPSEYMRLKVHMAGCSVCREFEKFSALVNKAMHTRLHSMNSNATATLEDNYKKDLQQKIDDFLNHDNK